MVKIYIFNELKFFLVCLLIFVGLSLSAQSSNNKEEGSTSNPDSKTIIKSVKEQEKLDKQEKKAYEKARKKAIKEHYERQSKSTKKQMKVSARNLKRYRKSQKNTVLEKLTRKRKYKRDRKKSTFNQKRKK